MREILFRGKRIDNGEWLYGYLVELGKESFSDNDRYGIIQRTIKVGGSTILYNFRIDEVRPETVGQYTGLTDINGTKIFEGDILEAISSLKRGVVKYNENYGMFVIEYDNTVFNLFNYQAACSCCVIANIYDNPELMKKGETHET